MKHQIKKARPGTGILWVNIARNWLHQGLLYMDKGERACRLFLEFTLVAIVFFIGLNFMHDDLILLGGSFVLVHSIFWIS